MEKLARFLGTAIFCCALLLIVLTAIPYGSVEFWWESCFEFGVFALTALWAVEAFVGGGFQWRRWLWLLAPAVALILFALVQTIPFGRGAAGAGGIEAPVGYAISADPFETFNFVLKLAALTLLGALLLRFTTSRARLRALVLTVIGVGVASAVFGVIRQATQYSDVGFVLPALPRGIGYAQIISRNQFAFMMEMALGVALGMVFRRGVGYESALVYLSLAVPVGAALILANSRGGILTMMCQLLLLAVFVVPAPAGRKEGEPGVPRPARGKRLLVSLAARAVLVVSLLALASVAVVHVGGERVVSNLSTVSEELGPADAATRWNTRRVDIWRATWEMVKDHPLAGVGFGGYWAAVPQYHDASGAYTPQQAHNDYLEILASGGVVGCALVLWFAFVLLGRAREVLRRRDSFRRAACHGALAGLFGVAVHSLFDFGLHLTVNSALFVALVVIASADVPGEGVNDFSLV